MPDDFNSSYLAIRQDKDRAEMAKLLQEADFLIAKEQAQAGHQAAPAQPQKQAPNGLSMGDVVQDAASAYAYAGAGLVDSVGGMVNDAVNVVTSRLFDYRFAQPDLSGALAGAGLSKPKTVGGKIGKDLLQWAVPYTAALKAASAWKPATKLAHASKAAAAGALADVSAFSPEEKNLSDMLVEMGARYPVLKNPITEFLATAPGDSHAEVRLKRVLEGAALGLMVDGAFHLLKATKGLFHAKGKDPVQALQESADQAARIKGDPSLVVDTAKAPDLTLQRQIELLTGANQKAGAAAQWQKRLDVQAAVRAADVAPAPKAPEVQPRGPAAYDPNLAKTAEGLEAVTPSRPLSQAERNEQIIRETMAAHEKAVAEGQQAHKVLFDTEEGSFVLTKGAPSPTQLDLDLALPEVVKKPKAVRTPKEDSALQSYKQLQEAALSGKNADAPTKAPTEPVAASAEVPQAHAYKKGDTVSWTAPDGSSESGHVVGLTKNGKLIVKTGNSGTPKVITPDPVDELLEGIQANNAALLKAAGKQQGGFIAPSVLAQLAAAQAGGVAGFMSTDDDATLADKLSLAGMGALAGLGIARVGAEKVLSRAERAVIENPDPLVKSLARKELEGIHPLSPKPTKRLPHISEKHARELADAVTSGDSKRLAASLEHDAFNFNRIDTDEDVKELFNATEAAFEKAKVTATGGVQTFEMIARNADLSGATPESLKGLYGDTAGLSSRVYAHRALMEGAAQNALKMIRLASDSGNPEDILAATKAMQASAAIQMQVRGIRTEIARTLSSMRMVSSTSDALREEMAQIINGMGGYENRMKMMRELAQFDDMAQLNAAIRESWHARTAKAVTEITVLGKLWSPTSHVANIVGNTLTLVGSVGERALARRMFGNADGVAEGEGQAQLFGLLSGLQDALRLNTAALKKAGVLATQGKFGDAKELLTESSDSFGSAWQAAATGRPVGRSTVLGSTDDSMSHGAVSAAAFELPSRDLAQNFNAGGLVEALGEMSYREYMGTFLDAFGAVTRVPGKALAAADELFWSAHYRGELHAQAHRIATREGLGGREFVDRVASIIHDPEPLVRSEAIRVAQEGTFQTPLHGMAASARDIVDAATLGPIPAGRLVVPFVKTPVNIMRYVGHRTPGISLLAQAYKEDIKVGGARAELAKARVVLGSGLYMLGGLMAMGITFGDTTIKINGGGDRRKDAEKLGGIQANSLQIGDKTYALNRLDPIGAFLLMGADLKDIIQTLGADSAADALVAAALSFGRNVTSKVYLSGIVDLFDAVQEVAKGNIDAGYRYLDNMVAGALPLQSAANAVKRLDDPVQREVWGLVDAIKNRTPGFSKDLPPSLDIFGNEVPVSEGWGPDWLSPVSVKEASTEPAAAEIARLNLDLRRPPRTIGGGNGTPGIDLTPKQYHRLMQLLGGGFKPDVTALVQSGDYQALPEDPSNTVYLEAKEKSIRFLYDAHKRGAVARLLEEDAGLRARFEQNLQNAANALAGNPLVPFPQPE